MRSVPDLKSQDCEPSKWWWVESDEFC